MASECVKVIVRCRPIDERERSMNCKEVISIDSSTAMVTINHPNDKSGAPKYFTFDGSYDKKATTEQIYADIGFPLVEGVTEGYNGTIFAYGQTGCGKSFTMQGIQNPTSQRGIIPRAFDHIFETIGVSEDVKYLVHASYLEIYNEEIRDLLGKDIKQKLELKEHPENGVYVKSLSMHPCKSVADCERVMERGWKNRTTAATLMNSDSSRSHSIFTISLERYQTDENGEEHIRAGKLNLVDLAGSERQAKTGSTGDRFKEATKINLSLSALGNVISALVDGKSKHIPYRDSKLTRLLQDSLGGNTKTLMVACISPADNNYDESLSTLRYANRAKNIKNKPKINEDPKDALLREYQEEIARLKAMLQGNMPANVDVNGRGQAEPQIIEKIVHVTNKQEIEEAKRRVREEFEAEMSAVRQELMSVKASKGEVEQEMNKLKSHYEEQIADIEKSAKHRSRSATRYNDEGVQYEIDENGHLIPGNGTSGRGKTRGKSVDARSDVYDVDGDVDALEAYRRLMQLQGNVIGGEKKDNQEIKDRRKSRKKYAEERRKRLQEALGKLDGDDVVLQVYDDVNDELRSKSKQLDKQKKDNEVMRREIIDLQSEFEFDRIDYLDTIRKQYQELGFLQGVIDAIHPTIRRDCNYINLDKVRSQSRWDEDNQRWVMPKLTVDKTHLPPANGIKATRNEKNHPIKNGDIYDELRSEDRFIQKLQDSEEQQMANNYFKTSRQDVLRTNNTRDTRQSSSHSYDSSLSRSSKSVGLNSDQEDYIRKPIRLEAITHTSGKSPKRKHKV